MRSGGLALLLLLLFSTITSDAASPTGVPPSPSMVCREPTDKGYCGEAPCWRCCYTHAAQDVTTKCLASCSSLVLKPPLFSRKKTLRSSKQVPSHIHVAAAPHTHARAHDRTLVTCCHVSNAMAPRLAPRPALTAALLCAGVLLLACTASGTRITLLQPNSKTPVTVDVGPDGGFAPAPAGAREL